MFRKNKWAAFDRTKKPVIGRYKIIAKARTIESLNKKLTADQRRVAGYVKVR